MQKILLAILFLVELSIPAYSQLFSVGIKAGVPLNDSPIATFPGAAEDPERWLIGPTAEIHLPFRLSLEVDALYRQQQVSVYPRLGSGPNSNQTFNDWQFPFLAKYELRGGVFRPFVDAGVSYRHVSGGPVYNPNSAGFTIGGGVTFKLLFLRLSPELRYTRWGSQSDLNGLARTPENQGDFLVGFTF